MLLILSILIVKSHLDCLCVQVLQVLMTGADTFATGTVAGLILAIIALTFPSPVELLAFSIHSRFILICLEYIPYVMMFLCATFIAFGIIEFMNRREDMEALILERKKS